MGCDQSTAVTGRDGKSVGGVFSCTKKEREQIKRYKVKKRLGLGNFSVVKRGIRREDNQEFAIKILDKKRAEVDVCALEASILRRTNHPNIVKMIETFESPSHVYLVLELLKGGSLLERLERAGVFLEERVSKVIAHITSAVAYLHRNGIAHRDLKLENILFVDESDDSLKLSDFGLSKYFGVGESKKKMKLSCGSAMFVAPEIVSGKPYDEQVDMWSLGVILYILLFGFEPFDGETSEELADQIRSGQIGFPVEEWSLLSTKAKDLVSNLLVVDPTKRFTAKQVLAHPFVSDNVPSDDSTRRASKRRDSTTNNNSYVKNEGEISQNSSSKRKLSLKSLQLKKRNSVMYDV